MNQFQTKVLVGMFIYKRLCEWGYTDMSKKYPTFNCCKQVG